MFQCQESEAGGRSLYMVVSESVFLLLVPEEKRKNLCTLTLWATLQTLARLERDLDAPSKLVFYWHKPNKRVCAELPRCGRRM